MQIAGFLTTTKHKSTGAKVSLVTEGKPEDQPYIADTLNEWDFNKFQEHLKGFISIFNIPLEPRVRPILFSALRFGYGHLFFDKTFFTV